KQSETRGKVNDNRNRRAASPGAVAGLSGADQAQSSGADADYLAGRHVSGHPCRRAVGGATVRQSGYLAVCRRRGGGQSCGGPTH
nr:hypothetical protein [Tanacetum cinerariifolium]